MRHSRRRGERGLGHLIDRRAFLGGSLCFLLSPAALVRAAEGPPGLADALRDSGFVYVSPLHPGGAESTCHGEVWFGWIDGRVVLITARDRWKARAVSRGWDRARIWVGDHGRWKRLLGRNEAFRQAPSFEAKGSFSDDAALLDRLLAIFDAKYPDEIDEWRERMRNGFRDGSRVLIRYAPLESIPRT